MVELGDRVKDRVSGFVGVVTSYATHLNGCDRVWISPPVDKDGKVVEGAWFDTIQLEVVDKAVLKSAQTGPSSSRPGGPPSKQK